MKGILGAIALDDHAITPPHRSIARTASGYLAGRTIHDDSPHEWLNLGGIIEVSSNIGAAKIALTLGADRYYAGSTPSASARTGIDLPGEASGLLRPPAGMAADRSRRSRFRAGGRGDADPARDRLRRDRQRRDGDAAIRARRRPTTPRATR